MQLYKLYKTCGTASNFEIASGYDTKANLIRQKKKKKVHIHFFAHSDGIKLMIADPVPPLTTASIGFPDS